MAIGYKSGTKDIADPVNMDVMSSGGGLYSTVEDLYLWDQALYRYLDYHATIILLLNQEDIDPSGYADSIAKILFGEK